MKKRIIDCIICILLGVLLSLTVTLRIRYRTLLREHTQATAEAMALETTKEIEKLNVIDKEILQETLNKVNKMIVLEGNSNINVTYTTKSISDEDINFKWAKDFITDISSKDLKIDALYKYRYDYDLKDMTIEITNNIPVIYINKNRLSLQIELIENESIYTDRVGLFESSFTSQELNSINKRTKELVYNKLINDQNNRSLAFESLQENIDELLGYECKYIINGFDVLETENEVKIMN